MGFEDEEDEVPANPTGISQTELMKSYLAFVVRSLKKHRLVAAAIFVVTATLTAGFVAILPPTYHCEMKLTALRNQVLEDEKGTALGGANELIKKHDNLIELAKRADLVRRWDTDRSGLLRFKDNLMIRLRGGGPSDADKLNTLVYMLDQRLGVQADEITLTIGVDWPNPETAARIVDAAEQSFLQARHSEEISTILEKIAILDQHATALRQEIDTDAEQLEHLREEKLAQTHKALGADAAATASATPVAAAPRRLPRIAPPVDEELPRLREELDAKKKTIADLEADRGRRLTEARTHLQEMQIKYTPAHPAALAAEQSIALLSRESDQVTSLRNEVHKLEADVKDRAAKIESASTGGGGGGQTNPGAAAAPKQDALPSDIMRLLDSSSGFDPTVSAHLSSIVAEYTFLQQTVRNNRLALDNAQAAFNHRYQVLVPVEVPYKPMKSKGGAILGGGWAAALLLALLFAVVAELRTGVIVERWQLYQMQLPVLAELKLPMKSGD